MAYIPPNPNGQATKANSSPVVFASDQDALPLSTGAATGAKQDTGNTSVASIDTKTPALGQALAAASVPVVLTAAQISTITPPAAITGFALDATLTGGTQQAKFTDGTNIANVLKNDGTAAGQNAQLVGSAYLSQTWSVTSVSNLTGIDAAGYSWVSVHITAQYTGSTPTITWQGSNDNSNWVGLSLIQPLSTLSSGSLSTASSGVIYSGPLNFRYFRLSFTGTYTSGTSTGTIFLSTMPRQTVNINGQVTLNGTTATNVSQINAVAPLMGNGVTGTGSQRVTIASDNTAFPVNATLSAETTKVIGTVNVAASQTVAVTNAGTFAVQSTLQSGSALVGKVGIDQTTPGTTNAVVDTPVTSGGLSIVTGSVGATATAIKASAGQLYGYHLFNTTAAVAYVQIFNVAAGSVALGTTAPAFSIGIPASGGATVNFDKGIAFGTAISFACTTTRTGSSGATCDVNFFYK